MGASHDARQRILDAAIELVAQGGVHAATPAAVAERANAGKMSLYRHFEDKAELMASALRESDERIRAHILGRTWTDNSDPRERLLSIFSAAAERADRPGYAGCPYVICGLEDAGDELAQAGTEHKDGVIAALETAAAGCGAADPRQLAASLLMLFDGAVSHAVMRGHGGPLRDATAAAAALIDAG